MVVHVFHNGGIARSYGYPDDTPVANVQVFTDGINDAGPGHEKYAAGLVWETSVVHDPSRKAKTWHWPHECGATHVRTPAPGPDY